MEFEKDIIPLTPGLKKFAMSMTRDNDDANDLVQNTLLKAFRFQDKFIEGSVKSWLYTICRNEYINEYRKRAKKPEFVDYTDYVRSKDHPVKEIDHNLTDELTEALNSLKERDKQIVLLCFINRYQHCEVARIVGVPEGTIKSILHRSKRKMKRVLYLKREK